MTIGSRHLRLENLCAKTTLRSTAALFVGTYEEALQYDPSFSTKLPALLGLPELEDNISEGVIIKPVQNAYMGNSRVILKNKNARFSEITAPLRPNKASTTAPADSTHRTPLQECAEELSRYMNQNRLDAILSKLCPVTLRDAPRLKGLLAKDAVEEFTKLHAPFEQLSPQDRNQLKKAAPSLADPVIRTYFEGKEE